MFKFSPHIIYDAQIPGVAINSSSAITGVEAICSPPPEHQPFNLPETYMHGKDAKAVVDPITLPGETSIPLHAGSIVQVRATRKAKPHSEKQ